MRYYKNIHWDPYLHDLVQLLKVWHVPLTRGGSTTYVVSPANGKANNIDREENAE